MTSLMGSHGVAIAATAVAAVSGTVILIAVCRQKPLLTSTSKSNLRSCISQDERRKKKKKKKRVHFAKDVVVEFNRESSFSGVDANEEEEEENWSRLGKELAEEGLRKMPANRAALYNGILRDRSRRIGCL